MTYATEFPEYPADAIPTLGDGWTDSSWHNDAYPSFIHEESGVVLWCDAEEDGFVFCQMVREQVLHGWQHTDVPGDAHWLLQCDTLGEVRDVLDSMAAGESLHAALLSARMRLNQLSADDARAIMAENASHPNPCPDLARAMAEFVAADMPAGPVEFTGAPLAYAFGHAIPAGTAGQLIDVRSGLARVEVTARDGARQIVTCDAGAVRGAAQ